VLTSDPNDPDAVLFFSTEDDIETEVHFKLEGETLTPILPDTGGVLVALDGDQLYGTSNYFYYDEFGNIDSRGDLWRAVESGVGVEGLLTTNGQNVFQLEVHGQSLYVRTTRALLRLPKSCQTADDTCRFTFGS
ncbi:MAG: hypothetical protein JNK04_21505, partial [Myxococcales bacterium]|nr:hypothetical protein [Myxococcales bacterium]